MDGMEGNALQLEKKKNKIIVTIFFFFFFSTFDATCFKNLQEIYYG